MGHNGLLIMKMCLVLGGCSPLCENREAVYREGFVKEAVMVGRRRA